MNPSPPTPGHSGDSIYPDFLSIGFEKIQANARLLAELQTLFSALENFPHELKEQEGIPGILQTLQRYVAGLRLFQQFGFYLVNPEDFSFQLELCVPGTDRPALEQQVQREIKSGRFAWALRKNGPVFFVDPEPGSTRQGLLHALGTSARRLGMFCGLLRTERFLGQEIGFSMLSILLGTGSEALASARHTADLQRQILLAHRDLERALAENEVLARFPAESPSPVLRLNRKGQLLYANAAAQSLLESLHARVGDLLTGQWLAVTETAFRTDHRQEFEWTLGEQTFAFVVVAVRTAGYANFYATDITARKRAEAERERLIADLQEALARVKTLSGLLPICSGCKKIRDDRGYWSQVDSYLQLHTDATFTHSLCPDCLKRYLDQLKG